jgi:HK97 gp10 family phage protein
MSKGVSFKVDLSKFTPGLKKLDNAARGQALANAAMAGGQVIEAQAKINAEQVFSGKARGELSGSIKTELTKSSDRSAEVSVGPSVVYGRIQELGGIVRPVTARMLSWIGDTGERIFAKMVRIPPRPYLRPAVDESKDRIAQAVEYQIRKAIGL